MTDHDRLIALTPRTDRALARLMAAKEALDISNSEELPRVDALADILFKLMGLRNEIGFAETRLIQRPDDPALIQDIAALEDRLAGLERDTDILCGGGDEG